VGGFECRFVCVMNHPAKACIDEHAIVKMRPLFLRIRMKKDSILDARDDRALVPYIDRDRISNMNRLAIMVAH
jgi:hypothetical protein